ncbi:fungal-specific transcription factor domain-containing protein [Schizophyllum amplum]|uniref:Fungal-specific transcription factor domain-containing protein n=1 Tax=Schizophyllum amplum TaxID=97359 RepID=A0A550CWU6_9AGAR|nr:fungal-specific transcription factor domain-containing protein [Auriculariopsis ampla]
MPADRDKDVLHVPSASPEPLPSSPASASAADASTSRHAQHIQLDEDQPLEFRRKDGSISRMRSHKGNVPVLPQTKLCPHCPAKFTRTTHLNRHMRNHTNDRSHQCETCGSQFTRSDLLTRHKKSCNDPLNQLRRKACISCTESKIKCDRQYPCAKCISRGKTCEYKLPVKRASVRKAMDPPPASSTKTSLSRPSQAAPPPSLSASSSISNTPSLSNSLPPSDGTSGYGTDFITSYRDPFPSSGFSDTSSNVYNSVASETATQTGTDGAPTHSHLASMYSGDMFQPFFSNVFSDSPPGGQSSVEDPSLGTDAGLHLIPSMSSTGGELHGSVALLSFGPSLRPEVSDMRSAPHHELSLGRSKDQLSPACHHHYALFYSAFLVQIPIVHVPTFRFDECPEILRNAVLACGALFVKTRKAASFIAKTLAATRELLMHEFATDPHDPVQQQRLATAVVLLQTIGLFHQRQDERASSTIFHGMLIMMIRRHNLIGRNAIWRPQIITEVGRHAAWREWVQHETTKRALLWAYMHDCCHSIYFALSPSFQPNEVALHLPCEDRLWNAQSADDWYMALQDHQSPYGDMEIRLLGVPMQPAVSSLTAARLMTTPIPLSPFGNFVLIHVILRALFQTCFDSRMPRAGQRNSEAEEVTTQEVFAHQYALHNWLQNWLKSPDMPKVDPRAEEPPFIEHSLPFYWLGQVALLAHQEGLPPFEPNSENNLNGEVRFKMVKKWLKHSRGFVRMSDKGPTVFWDELMKIRLQTWQLEMEDEVVAVNEDDPGLLGFFPES